MWFWEEIQALPWSLKLIHVVVGLVSNVKNEILITQRPVQKSYSGYWEFPGGKKEIGETPYQTLVREMKEELDVEVLSAEPWQQLTYHYPEKTVLLDMWIVIRLSGELKGLENQAFQWVPLDKLHSIDLLPANKLILDEVIARFSCV